jgi:hypothetical protein
MLKAKVNHPSIPCPLMTTVRIHRYFSVELACIFNNLLLRSLFYLTFMICWNCRVIVVETTSRVSTRSCCWPWNSKFSRACTDVLVCGNSTAELLGKYLFCCLYYSIFLSRWLSSTEKNYNGVSYYVNRMQLFSSFFLAKMAKFVHLPLLIDRAKCVLRISLCSFVMSSRSLKINQIPCSSNYFSLKLNSAVPLTFMMTIRNALWSHKSFLQCSRMKCVNVPFVNAGWPCKAFEFKK